MVFKNKVVVVTGASSGIGKSSAIKFSQKGADVVLVSRKLNKLQEVEKKINKLGGNTLSCQCDVSQKNEVKNMTNEVLEKFGRVCNYHK